MVHARWGAPCRGSRFNQWKKGLIMKSKFIIAAVAALSLGAVAAQAAPPSSARAFDIAKDADAVAQAKGGYGGWSYYGAGPNYYLQQYPGPNCYSYPHPDYGWICY
jgi:hypothetical protein